MDMVAIKIKIINEDYTLGAKMEVVKDSLKSLINHIEEVEKVNGVVQRARGANEDFAVEYVHLIGK